MRTCWISRGSSIESQAIRAARIHFSSGRATGLVVLPAADIAEIAKQAAAIQAQPKPVEAAKPIEIPAKVEVTP